MSIDRRKFIDYSVKSLTGLYFLNDIILQSGQAFASSKSKGANAVQDLINKTKKTQNYLSMTGVDPTAQFILDRNDGDVGAVNPGVAFFNDQGESAIVNVPIFAHSVEQNPNHLSRIMAIPRRGNKCCEYDVLKNKVTNILTPNDKKFYGHGTYVPDSDLFYASTFLHSAADATMVLFDLKSQKVLKEILVDGGAGAHQCALSKDKRHLIVTYTWPTATHKASVAWIDIKTGVVVDRIYGMPNRSEHFTEVSDGYLVYTGGPLNRKDPTVIGSIGPDKTVANVEFTPDELKSYGKGLSVSICTMEEKELSFITSAGDRSVYVVNYKTRKLIQRIAVPSPRGIVLTHDRKKLLVTSLVGDISSKSDIYIIDVDQLKIVDSFSIKGAVAYSSHAAKYQLPS